MPYRLSHVNIEAAAAKDESAWPDGKEKPSGAEISSVILGSAINGRGRAIMFLSARLPIISPKTSEPRIIIPHFLVFLKIKNTTAIKIQSMPLSPN